MNIIHSFLSASFVVLLSSQISGQETVVIDPVGETLDAAIAAYEQAVVDAKEELLAKIDAKIADTATSGVAKQGRIELFDSLKMAREKLSSENTVPTLPELSGITASYSRRLAVAKAKCIDAYETAIKAYQRKNDLDSAKAVQTELFALENPQQSKQVLASGTIFKGTRTNDLNKNTGAFEFHVTSIRNDTLEGVVHISRPNGIGKHKVTGSYKGDRISLKLIGEKGLLHENYEGTYRDGELEMTFKGAAAKGGPVAERVKATLVPPVGRTKR